MNPGSPTAAGFFWNTKTKKGVSAAQAAGRGIAPHSDRRSPVSRARVASGQKYEVGYESKKTGRSAASVKKAVKKVGNVHKRVEKKLGRKKAR